MKILLGVTGCIGAYKSALVLRLLQKKGHEIVPVMTRSAEQFIGALTLEKLSGNRVLRDLFEDGSTEIEHIAAARGSDLLLVAPATANILAKFANGIADDFLTTLYLSTTTPVVVAPAMNVEMWHHPATRRNVSTLRERGVTVVEPGVGYQACGEYGEGRLAEPEEIIEVVTSLLNPGKKDSLKGRKVLVTAGPTIEDLDSVRFISNRSSGKMGYAIANEAARRGADVTLVSGPTHLAPPKGVEVFGVRSAAEMAEVVFNLFPSMDIVVKAAAVSDFTPRHRVPQKMKKTESPLSLELEPTIDILKHLGEIKSNQYLVGFAAESEDLLTHAREKLRRKNLDLIIANDISEKDSGFEVDHNRVVLLDREGNEIVLPRLSKNEVASRLWDHIEQRLATRIEVSK
ncbi:MAG TPA: bifunctional phosphopantothenoylcysteine decarboxylase/phosphopantothenate--cysteine ligase CoaBC [Acidobacteriota bacterium]|nr:bifunctional phosphopantothenoylcysteine decarboxylase/phosphopantothenate--cysteine ligase CoaBC [Acidobacteriota bacterium]